MALLVPDPFIVKVLDPNPYIDYKDVQHFSNILVISIADLDPDLATPKMRMPCAFGSGSATVTLLYIFSEKTKESV